MIFLEAEGYCTPGRRTDTGRSRGPLCLLKTTRERTLIFWQKRWDMSTKGRWTFSFFPSVKFRMERENYHTTTLHYTTPHYTTTLENYMTQMLSGHGEFRGWLHSLTLSPLPNCAYGDTNLDTRHIMWHSELTKEAREKMSDGLRGITTPAWNVDLMSNRENFECLIKFVKSWVIACT